MKNLTIKQIICKLENSNIQVNEYKEGKKLCGYELNTYTDAGVNMIVFIDFRNTECSPKDAKAFIELYNERVNYIDIDEELKIHLENVRYRNEIGATIGVTDFKDWKENLKGIFTNLDKTPQQRQFEQVKDKLTSLQKEMETVLELMPTKGAYSNDCQKMALLTIAKDFDHHINGIELEDFTPNEYSGSFKLSYS
jgi:hypothetical protein